MNDKQLYDELLSMLRTRSMRTGRTFKLASGRTSDFFIDCKATVLSGRGHHLVGAVLLPRIMEMANDVEAVAGVELGGCPLASAVAMMSSIRGMVGKLDALYVRKAAKDHGTERLIEGTAHVRPRATVVLLEDVLTTGGSALSAVETLLRSDFVVRGVLALVDREEGAAEAFAKAHVPFASVYTQTILRAGP
jgi:orotate phosphoribosyltransferase